MVMAQARQSKRQTRSGRPELLIALVLIGGAVVTLAVGAILANRPVALTVDGDVVSGAVIRAVHEMSAGAPPPFLPKDGPQPNVTVDKAFHDFGRKSVSLGRNDSFSTTRSK